MQLNCTSPGDGVGLSRSARCDDGRRIGRGWLTTWSVRHLGSQLSPSRHQLSNSTHRTAMMLPGVPRYELTLHGDGPHMCAARSFHRMPQAALHSTIRSATRPNAYTTTSGGRFRLSNGLGQRGALATEERRDGAAPDAQADSTALWRGQRLALQPTDSGRRCAPSTQRLCATGVRWTRDRYCNRKPL